MKTAVPDLSAHEDDLFDEFPCLQNYCDSKPEVRSENIDQNIAEKWWQILAHFTMENINDINIEYLISFCLHGLGMSY